jgi:adenosylcobinamide-phosphate synthase
MSLEANFSIVTLALLIEAAVGYPDALYRTLRHPVVWIGAVLDWLEQRFNRNSMPELSRRLNGARALALVLFLSLLPALAIQFYLLQLLPWFAAVAVLAVLASAFLAQRSLWVHVEGVAEALERGNLCEARTAVARVVGRDAGDLDESGASRAAVESLAENFSDGVVAPAFWCALFGLPGIATYKAINTADSMVGHRDKRYAAFGWTAAKLDDLVNLPVSRIAALLIVAAGLFHRDASVRGALATTLRDARKARSPNAGWPEAAMAGALGIRLAGPRSYGGRVVEDQWMGDGRKDATANDIRRALALYRTACTMQIAVYAPLALLIARG